MNRLIASAMLWLVMAASCLGANVTVALVADLATARPGDGDIVSTLGYTVAGTGANTYRYDADSAATVNGGTVIDGPGSVGRYIAIDQTRIDVTQFGAVGDGVADDTTEIQAAIDTGKTVTGSSGSVFIVSSITLDNDDQQLIGISLKRKDETTGTCIIVSGDDVDVTGITFDGNVTGQTVANDAARYNYYGIRITGERCSVSDSLFYDEAGLAIASTAGTRHAIRNNRIKNAGKAAIFMADTAADPTGIEVSGNSIDTAHDACFGIAVYGNNDNVTSRARRCVISNNYITGLTTGNQASQSSGINLRGTESTISGNVVLGFQLGISCDVTNSTVVSGNRVESESLGIEVLGRQNTISGNVVIGGTVSISMTEANDPSVYTNDRNAVTGNTCSGFSARAIHMIASTQIAAWTTATSVDSGDLAANDGIVYSAGSTGTTGATPPTHVEGAVSDGTITWTYVSTLGGENTISGNTIDAQSTTAGITLAGRGCRGTLISANAITGPGKSTSNSRAIQLDQVLSDVTITGNHIAGFQRAVMLYSPSAATWLRIHATGNSHALDGIAPQLFLSLEGSATLGAGCYYGQNNCGFGLYNLYEMYDAENSRMIMCSQFTANPEGAVTAGIGSVFINRAGGAGTTLYIKESGTGNTGWVAK